MKILLLAPYPPYPLRGGGALRVYHLLRGLAALHELTLLTFAPDVAAVAALAPLREHCRVVTVLGPPRRGPARRALTTITSPLPDMALRNRSRPFAEALSRLLAAERFDVVQAESIELAGYALQARGLGPLLALDQFNAEYLLQRRAALRDLRRGLALRPQAIAAGLYSLAQWRKLARYEARLLRELDLVTVVSEEDRVALARLGRTADVSPVRAVAHPPPAPLRLRPGQAGDSAGSGRSARMVVVPNGVDTATVRPSVVRGESGPATLVFTATMDYRPNIDAARWFVGEVLPLIRAGRPDARLLLVGRAAGPAVRALADAHVEVIGEVPDVAPYIGGAAVYVVPMLIGGGSRLKLLEALAMEAAVVSTPMGAEGIEGLRDGEHLLIATTPRAFAEAALRLIADPALGRRLGAAGRAHVAAHYDWSAIVPRLEAAYVSLR